jgi:Zn-dependent protease
MLMLLRLPLELLRFAFYAVGGLIDSLRGRDRLRVEFTVLIDAPREAVWRFSTADRVVLDGPPAIEYVTEPVPDGDGLFVTRVSVDGQPRLQVVWRELECDAVKGTTLCQAVPHPLSVPPEGGNDCLMGSTIEERPEGTALTVFNELTIRSFRERIAYPIGLRSRAILAKRQCEKEAGTNGRMIGLADNWLVLSVLALCSFWYLLGWQKALLLATVVILHEAGHALAMRMAGVQVRGIYLIPFFGGAAVAKSPYLSEGRLGFIALMGPAFSLIPTLGLAVMFQATGGDTRLLLDAAWMFAFINASNLLPIYPLDGGLIINALLGSLNRRVARVTGWIGILTGLAFAAYWHSFLIGIPFFLFALQRYLDGGRTLDLRRLSLAGGAALGLAFVTTFATYGFVLNYIRAAPAAQTAARLTQIDYAGRGLSEPARMRARSP